MKRDLGHFKRLAPSYERFIQPKAPEIILAQLGLPQPDGAVLDAGGGTGRVAQFLVGQTSQVVVADQTFEMLLEAHRKDGVTAIHSHAEELPFPDGYFCCVIMVDALHHVVDQAATIRELWRVLKPGGRVIIEEPDIRRLSVKLLALAEKLALMRSRFLSPPQILAFFNDPSARKRVEVDGWTAWMIVEKTSNSM